MAVALIVISGLPGTGKTLVAEQSARIARAALVSKDVLEAALWRGGVRREANSGWIAYELLGAIADLQLAAGLSVVLDSVATNERIRAEWRALAGRHGHAFLVVECVCTDAATHRSRIEGRQRGIPGWYELTWSDVEEVASRYEPWTADRLVLDAVRPLDENVAALREYLAGRIPR